MKLYERDELREDVWEWILRSNRLPVNMRADLDAIGGCGAAASASCATHGSTVRAADWIMQYSEKRLRDQAAGPRQYEAESTLDYISRP